MTLTTHLHLVEEGMELYLHWNFNANNLPLNALRQQASVIQDRNMYCAVFYVVGDQQLKIKKKNFFS
jgi:hypothetical protein